ncbi:MAG: hypothetical protein LQ342_006137 [Letrouitia transgressa]|nr:MAG: hypothetical protein LQ342_006137 [Letrouitia transgressa]
MSDTQELTFSDVSAHNSKKDLYVVIHDKVYNATSFIDEHPGGEEVLLDVAGQDATEAFEDVGHSDEAREILAGLETATLKRLVGFLYSPNSSLLRPSRELRVPPGDPAPHAAPSTGEVTNPKSDGAGLGVVFYALVLVGAGLAFGAYQYLQSRSGESK